jgi:exosortase
VLNWVLGLNVILGVFAYREFLRFQPQMYSAASMVDLTRDVEEYLFRPSETAPLLVALLSFWLVYRRRYLLYGLPLRSGPNVLAGSLIAIGCLIFAWQHYTLAPDLGALSLIFNLAGAAVLWRGTAALRILRLPLVLLLFALPIPAPMIAESVWWLQCQTATLSGWLLGLLGIPALVSTQMIHLAGQSFQVIEGCSGLRSIETLAMLSVLMVDLFARKGWHAGILILASVPVAFMLNGLRVLTLILNPHSEIHSIHTLQGVVILLGGLVLLYLLDGQLERFLPAPSRRESEPEAPTHVVSPLGRALVVSVVLLALIGISTFGPVWERTGTGPAQLARLPETVSRDMLRWDSEDLPRQATHTILQTLALEPRWVYRRYTSEILSTDVDIFVGVGNHLDRFRSTYSPKTALPGRGWIVEDSGQRQLEDPNLLVEWKLLRLGTKRLISYHWHDGYRGLASESARTFFGLDRSPFSRELPLITVRLSTAIDAASEEQIQVAHRRLEQFYRALTRDLDTYKRELREAPEARVSLSLPIFHLWESFFHRRPIWRKGESSEINGLHRSLTVA